MLIAFVGKGGSDKTTAAAAFSHLAAQERRVVAVDADINQHLNHLVDGPGEYVVVDMTAGGDQPRGARRRPVRPRRPRA